MGEIKASFHSIGSSSISSDDWKIAVKTSASCSAARIRMHVGIPSGPDILWGLRFFIIFNTPSLWKRICFGCCLYQVVQKWLLLYRQCEIVHWDFQPSLTLQTDHKKKFCLLSPNQQWTGINVIPFFNSYLKSLPSNPVCKKKFPTYRPTPKTLSRVTANKLFF